MNAPDPALAGLLPAVRTTARPAASARAGETQAPGAAGADGDAAAPAFDLLEEDTAAAPGAGVPADGPKAPPLRGKLTAAFLEEIPPADPAAPVQPDAGIATILPLPAAPLAAAAAAPAPGNAVEKLAGDVAAGTPAAPKADDAAAAVLAAGIDGALDGAPSIAVGAAPAPAASLTPALAATGQGTAPAREASVPTDAEAVVTTGAPAAATTTVDDPRHLFHKLAVSPEAASASPDPSAAAPAPAAATAATPMLPPGWQLVPQAIAPAAAAGSDALPVVRPEAVIGQVAVAVGKSGGTSRKVELRLDPPELGRVEIHLTPTDKGTLHATVVAERADTHDLLRRHGDVLARELGAAGYSDVTLSFSAGGDTAAGRGLPAPAPEPRDAAFAAVAEDPAAAPVASRRLSVADGGLDIRL